MPKRKVFYRERQIILAVRLEIILLFTIKYYIYIRVSLLYSINQVGFLMGGNKEEGTENGTRKKLS